MCVFNIVGLVRPSLVFNKAASLNLYLHPRSRKIRSKIGIELFRVRKEHALFYETRNRADG